MSYFYLQSHALFCFLLLEIVNRLCEARIRLHKLLTIAHTFPQNDSWDAAKKVGGKEMVECMNKGLYL